MSPGTAVMVLAGVCGIIAGIGAIVVSQQMRNADGLIWGGLWFIAIGIGVIATAIYYSDKKDDSGVGTGGPMGGDGGGGDYDVD
jgi:uncharacterized membrane protein HdeD (DUF308 family)